MSARPCGCADPTGTAVETAAGASGSRSGDAPSCGWEGRAGSGGATTRDPTPELAVTPSGIAGSDAGGRRNSQTAAPMASRTNIAMPTSADPDPRLSSSDSEGPADEVAPAVYPHRHIETFDGTRRAHFGQVHDRPALPGSCAFMVRVHALNCQPRTWARRLPLHRAELERASNMSPDSNDDREFCAEDDATRFQILPAGAAVIARREHWRVDACVTHQDCSESLCQRRVRRNRAALTVRPVRPSSRTAACESCAFVAGGPT